ncbi:MAG TPA: tetratricopeptide repeat protein [Syntrophales bacterium]|jgi:tetratricopeptide (TPR) repeat protein|nr:tetratricopeptide repeat protein [Syntrophales bacterium]HRT61975.1 tetratricopeptide repeat protein [Syntrophales bacterium]
MFSIGPAASAEALFAATIPSTDSLQAFSDSALSRGATLYRSGKYAAAAREFRISISLTPNSSNAPDAVKYLASSYVKLGNVEQAVDEYRAYLKLNPSSSATLVNLGNLLYAEDRYDEAVVEYEKAVKLDPGVSNRFSLGQAYLQAGEYEKARRLFLKMQTDHPQEAAGYLGLGQAYGKMGRYEKAVEQFERAIRLKPRSYDAYAELGYVYADMGKIDKAMDLVGILDEKAPALGEVLSRYVYKVDPPKIEFVYSGKMFPFYLSMNTPVSFLDTSLTSAGAYKIFSMKFQFDKALDRQSAENPANWEISRAHGVAPALYNFGLGIPSTETQIPFIPDYVVYDAKNLTATIFFRVYQNETANATIDPSHIEFRYKGKDSYGLSMDPARDQFTGFSGVF